MISKLFLAIGILVVTSIIAILLTKFSLLYPQIYMTLMILIIIILLKNIVSSI